MVENEENQDSGAPEEASHESQTAATAESPEEVSVEAPAADSGEGPGADTENSAATIADDSAGATADDSPEAGTETPADAPAASTKPKSRKRWYVVHTYSGHENKVRANLERAIQYAKQQDKFGEVLVATEDYVVVKAGKKHITKRKTFPSYVIVEMEMGDDTRALVTSIPGVTHFVGDKNAAPLTEAEVARIRGEEVQEKGQVTTEVPFKVGESVRVTEGPFADFVGTVDEINLERGKLRVMVSIFGRATAVELDIMHVSSV